VVTPWSQTSRNSPARGITPRTGGAAFALLRAPIRHGPASRIMGQRRVQVPPPTRTFASRFVGK